MGTPNELTNEKGEVVWLVDYEAWGNVSDICKEFKYQKQTIGNIEIDEVDLQPIRFQGQFFDKETGLHYNRFRYYDPDLGMFISRDPIGLNGGLNVFAYAPNPVMWVDPFGLKFNTVRVLSTPRLSSSTPGYHRDKAELIENIAELTSSSCNGLFRSCGVAKVCLDVVCPWDPKPKKTNQCLALPPTTSRVLPSNMSMDDLVKRGCKCIKEKIVKEEDAYEYRY